MPTRPRRLAVETLEDRTTPAITAVFNSGVLTVSLSANDNVTVGGLTAAGTDIFVVAGNFAQQNFNGVTSIVVNDTSGGGATNQRVGFADVGGAARTTITGPVTVTAIETIALNNPVFPLSASNITFSGASVVNTINTLPQLSTGGTISITATGAGDAIGTAANPIRVTWTGSPHLTTNTSAGNGNQFFDFGGSLANVNNGIAGPVNAGTGTVTLTNGLLTGIDGNNFADNTGFNIGTGGTLTFAGTEGIAGLSGTGNVQPNSSAATLVVGNNNATSTFGGTLTNATLFGTGALSLRKAGTGLLTLTNANTYTGGTTISNGQLQYSNATALGTGTVTLVDANTVAGANPTLLSTGAANLTVANTIVIGSTGQVGFVGSSGAATGAVNYTGTVTLSQTMFVLAGTTNAAGTRFTGRITGTGGVVVNNGGTANTLAVLDNPNATNNFTGNVTIGNDVILQLTQTSFSVQIPDAATVFFDNAGSVLRLFAISDTVAALQSNSAGAGVVDAANGGPSTLTVGGNSGSGTFSGVLRDGTGGTLSLSKTGNGTQVLSGTNTYTGATTIDAGTLQIGAGGTTGTLGTAAVTNNGTLTFNRSDTIFVGNAIGGSGNLVKQGTNSLSLTANNTYTGTTTISAGQFNVGAGGTTGTLGTGAVTNNGVLTFARSDAVTVANAISGTGGVAQLGAGVVTLTGANTYTGATQINSGFTIRVGDGGTTGTLGTGQVFNGGTVVFNRSNALAVSAAIIQGTIVRQEGTGTTVLTGANTYSGTTTIAAGTLQVGSGGTTGTLGTGAVTNNAALVFNRSDAITVANAISGSGTLVQAGTGTTTLTGTKTYNGTTSATAGTLLVNALLVASPTVTVSGTDPNDSTFLGGNGTIFGGVQVQNGGVIGPGDTNTTATLGTGSLSFQTGGAFGVKIAGGGAGQFDALTVTGIVTLTNGGLFAVPTGPTPAIGTVLRVIDNDQADPVVGTFAGLPEGAIFTDVGGNKYKISYVGGTGNDVTLTALPSGALVPQLLVSGPPSGAGLLFAPAGGQYGGGTTFSLVPGFVGELHVALGDVNGDGTPDRVVGTGPGDSRVRVIDGANGTVLADFIAFPGYTGGVFVAVGDLNGDTKADIAVTPDAVDAFSGPVPNQLPVKVFSGAGFGLLASFDGLASLSGASGQGNTAVKLGGRPAIADVNGDGLPDLLIAAGSGGGPRITVWNGTGFAGANGGKPTANPVANLFVFESTQRGGAFVTSGDVNGDGFAEIIVGGGPGGGPRVRIVNAKLLFNPAIVPALEGVDLDAPANLANGLVLNNFFAGSDTLRGGVRVAVHDVDGDGLADVVVGSGSGEPSRVRVYKATALATAFGSSGEPGGAQVFDPFGVVLPGGVWVG